MKSLLASSLCLLLLLTLWGFYCHYSDIELHGFIDNIENNILVNVESSQWDQAEIKFEQMEKNWHKYKKIAYFFFSTDKLNDADYSIARAKYYIKSKDVSNSSGELSCLIEQLTFLHENEMMTLENIF